MTLTRDAETAPIDQAADWLRQGRKAALATVVKTWGSSPCPVGSHLAIAEDGGFAGSVSGGCIEGDVITEALDLMEEGGPKRLKYGVSNEQAWQVGLACGGAVHVLLERLDPRILDRLAALRAAKISVGVASHMENGSRAVVTLDTVEGDLAVDADTLVEIRARIRADRTGALDTPAGEVFLRVYAPPLRMIIVGAVHVAQHLIAMSGLAGFAVTVIDPRTAFATDERFPDITLLHDWPDEAMASLKPDSRTAVVTLTHDPKLDDPALAAALRSDAFYIGALGSTRTQAARIERLTAEGFSAEELSRIHGPVGLDINALTPAEIAVSILAQIIAVRRADARPRKEKAAA